MEWLAWFEETALSTWVREEPWVFPFILSVHALGMGLSAGVSTAINLRSLGLAPRVPVELMKRFLPLVWIGFSANTLSGVMLLIGYPAKALTNWLFYGKLLFLALGVWTTIRLCRQLGNPSAEANKKLAVASLLCWAGVIVAGRFLAYTYTILLAMWWVE
ncbi:MAG TPA: hypothetical protein VK629_12930 [Steroidobacteraceae bacterium]|nr:hypothetical protein [Steroidobacteraceae bacterium]